MVGKPFETFDTDLLEGKAHQDSFARLLCKGRFEHKFDKKARTSGNICVEFEKKMADGRIEKSGIGITTAEWWIHEFSPECRLVVPVEHLGRLVSVAVELGHNKWIGDARASHCALIPWEWVLRGPPEKE